MKPFPVRHIWKPGNQHGIVLAVANDSVLVAWDDHTLRVENPAELMWTHATLDWPQTEDFKRVAWPEVES